MSKKPRRKFTDQYKAEAVTLVRSSAKSVGQIAKDLGLTDSALREWVKLAGGARPRAEGPLDETERARLRRLEDEVRVLRMERDFLKKAAAFFAKETT
jgi:transposase